MDLNKENQQREEFRNILYELSKSQERLQDASYRANIYKRLETLYYAPVPDQRFRHFYSDIFSVLAQIKQDPDPLWDINILGQNLALIRRGYQPKNFSDHGKLIDISDSIKKLYDHVNLDIARMSYSMAEERRISSEEAIQNIQNKVNATWENIKNVEENQKNIDQNQKTIEESQRNIEQNQKDIEENQKNIEKNQQDMENKITDQQKDYITILGIFASVVLAFTAGIAFSTSVLNNIAQASIYRTILITLMIGLVLANILFGLFFYINKIVNKEAKIHPLLISNAIFLLLILLTILAWSLGWVEGRDERIHNTAQKQPETVNLEL